MWYYNELTPTQKKIGCIVVVLITILLVVLCEFADYAITLLKIKYGIEFLNINIK